MDFSEVEGILSQSAERLGVSEAKLRAVYMRGIAESMQNGYEGASYLHGLARVQRFVVAMSSNSPRLTPDSDFIAQTATLSDESFQLDINEFNAADLLLDTVSGKGAALQSIFPNESVTEVVFNNDTRELVILGEDWNCTFNIATGQTNIGYNRQ